jgi:hypothetical protein
MSFSDDGYLVLWDLRAHDKSPQRVLFSPGGFNCVDFNPKISHLFVSGHSRDSAQYDSEKNFNGICENQFLFWILFFSTITDFGICEMQSQRKTIAEDELNLSISILWTRGMFQELTGIKMVIVSVSYSPLKEQNHYQHKCLVCFNIYLFVYNSIFSLFCTKELSNGFCTLSKRSSLCLL